MIVLVTMGDQTMDMARAWALMQQSWSAPSLLISLQADADATVWCEEHFRTQLIEYVADGSIKIPGFQAPPSAPPLDMLEQV